MQYIQIEPKPLPTCYLGIKGAHLGASRRVQREDQEGKSKLGSHSENNLQIVDLLDDILLDISRDTLSKVGRALTVTNNWHSFSGHTYYLASWQLSYDTSWGQIRQESHLTVSAILLKVKNHAGRKFISSEGAKKSRIQQLSHTAFAIIETTFSYL